MIEYIQRKLVLKLQVRHDICSCDGLMKIEIQGGFEKMLLMVWKFLQNG
jgi:hypothetical protein